MDSKLNEFIQAGKSKGVTDESLVALLTRRGWPADDVYAALGEYWAGLTGVAVPGRGSSTESAREAFLYLLAFSTLCSWTTALGSAMFTIIDHWFPDAVTVTPADFRIRTSVTWEMATLLVSFPIFLLVMRAIVKETAAHPEQLQSGVRKWLTYIALLGTAGTMIGDLIWFFDYLLSGEITVRFFLKSAVVMILCGAIFLYYLRSLRPRGSDSDPRWSLGFASASAIAVAAVFLIGLTVAGTPAQIRRQQADEMRTQALRHLGRAINARFLNRTNRGQAGGLLALTELVQESRVSDTQTRDPETKMHYEYRTGTGTQYELCANFSNASRQQFDANASPFWLHGIGRTCFALDAGKTVPYYISRAGF